MPYIFCQCVLCHLPAHTLTTLKLFMNTEREGQGGSGAQAEAEDTQTVAFIHAADATQAPPPFRHLTFMYEYIL